jgi:hypothetical protein
VVFKLNSNGTWSQERRLLPDDGNLPRTGIVTGSAAISGAGTAFVYFDADLKGTEESISKGHSPVKTDDTLKNGNKFSSASIGPSTRVVFYDTDEFTDSGFIEIHNRSENYFEINFTEKNPPLPAGVTVIVSYDPPGIGAYTNTYIAGEKFDKDKNINLWDFNDDMERTFMETLDIDGSGPSSACLM